MSSIHGDLIGKPSKADKSGNGIVASWAPPPPVMPVQVLVDRVLIELPPNGLEKHGKMT